MNTQPTSRIRRGSSRALRAAALLALAGCHSTVPIESQCAVTSDCDEGLACVGGLCRAPCNVDRDCPASGRCVTGTAASGRVCVNETFRPVCARSSECASPLVCGPGGLCVAQCAVDADCASLHATARCGAGGECALPDETCADAGARCSDACVDLSRDPLHCGACGRACTAPIGGSATCVGGVCGASCEPGMHRCGAACVRDGDVATCGTSCVPCVAPAGATPTCASGACGFVCPTGTAACAGRCST